MKPFCAHLRSSVYKNYSYIISVIRVIRGYYNCLRQFFRVIRDIRGYTEKRFRIFIAHD
jgi:hypothetical protein